MKKIEKTNVMRILDKEKIDYEYHTYIESGVVSGTEVAAVLGQNPERVLKTLVTEGASKKNYVFVIPVCRELDLKKAAKVVGEKSIAMIKSKDLLPLTGYIHGGCSPIGMKKFFRTTVDISALSYDKIIFSGGKIGYQIEMTVSDLKSVIRFDTADLCTDA